MKVHWHRVLAVIAAVGVLVLWVKFSPHIRGFLGAMNKLGPGNTPEDQLSGIIALAFVGITVVAIVRILTSSRS